MQENKMQENKMQETKKGIINKKEEKFSEWYREIITKAELIEYYDISGCYVLLPDSYFMWETIQEEINKRIKKMGVKNSYFPLFASEKNLEKEKEHLEGFSPEVAWITKAGEKDLEEKIAIRPTSECIIYPIMSKMIRSHQDLPLKLNQWCNVVRWEFKDPTPFIRSREFLWQEGHTCFKSKEEALVEAKIIIDLYRDIYKDILAIPVIQGIKTKSETFAGAEFTYTVESMIPELGKGIQAATSHHLGQHFSKIFDINFLDINNNTSFVWQNSWGFTTRSLGIMLMNHSDNKGLVLPPKIAPIQIVIVPIVNKHNKHNQEIIDFSNSILSSLSDFRSHIDLRKQTPGWKFNYWELHGVPLRIVIGPDDFKNNTIILCLRHNSSKITVSLHDLSLPEYINSILSSIHSDLYTSAQSKFNNNISHPDNLEQLQTDIFDKKICYLPWCESTSCELFLKDNYHIKSLCVPLTYSHDTHSACLVCKNITSKVCLFGKSL